MLKPRWIILTILVAVAAVVMIRLGIWQLDRLHGRRQANDIISTREATPPTPLADVVADANRRGVPDDAVWRQVTITGTYRTDDQVLVRNRPENSSPGFWVITPLVAPDGSAVSVNRGWVPINIGDGGPKDAYQPPGGAVTVTGLVRETEVREGLEPEDPGGHLATLSRVDIPRFQQQVGYPLSPYWIQLTGQQPAQTGVLPVKIDTPELDDGPHLNYAGQWFIFAGLTIVVYPLSIRRAARTREARQRYGDDEYAKGDGEPTRTSSSPETGAEVDREPVS
jgi:cytochrome oxidase assembly protein ShyY1